MEHSEELGDYQRQFRAIQQDARELVTGMDEGALAWRPEPGRWSIAENLLHLNVVGERYVEAIDECVAGARERRLFSRGPFRYGLFGKLLVEPRTPRAMMPPAEGPVPRGWTWRAPRWFRPSCGACGSASA